VQQRQEPLPIRLQDDLDVRFPLGDAEVIDDGLAAAPFAAGFDGDEAALEQGDGADVAILRPIALKGER
jgi:hypothetical protein